MKRIAERKKNVKRLFEEMQGREWLLEELEDVLTEGNIFITNAPR